MPQFNPNPISAFPALVALAWLLASSLTLGATMHPDLPDSPTVWTVPDGAAERRVGVGTGCTHSTIQAAVNSVATGASVIIRVNQNTYTEAVSIADKSVQLLGGFTGCTATVPTGFSTLQAPLNSRPLTISASTGSRISWVGRFNLAGGNVSSLEAGGGLWITASGSAGNFVTLENTFVEVNGAGNGGGVAVQSLAATARPSVNLASGSTINNNDALADGGGIWCAGPGTNRVYMSMASVISNNIAGPTGGSSGRGGGLFLDNCSLEMRSSALAGFPPTSIRNNTSRGSGGGIHARNNSALLLWSLQSFSGTTVSPRAVEIRANQAIGPTGDPGPGQGGGIWLGASTLDARGLWIDANTATGNGGGIHAAAGSTITYNRNIEHPISGIGDCHSTLECARITANNAGDTGGAIFLRDSGTVATIEQTVIRDNSAQAGAGASLFAQTGTNLTVTSSLLYGGNAPAGPPNYVFWVGESAIVNLFWSTVVDNLPGSSVFRFGGTNSLLRLRGSIIHEPGRSMGTVSVGNTPNVDSDCVVWHIDSLMNAPYNFTGGAAFHQVANPLFNDPGTRNYHLTPNSPAVDFCDSSTFPGTAPTHDLVLGARGIPVKETSLHGPFDLGALEFMPDVIFADRFQ